MGMFQSGGMLGKRDSVLNRQDVSMEEPKPEGMVDKAAGMVDEAMGSETGIALRNKVSDVLKAAGESIKPDTSEKVKRDIVSAKNALIDKATSFFSKGEEDMTEMEKLKSDADNLWNKVKDATGDAIFDSRIVVGEILSEYGEEVDPSTIEEIESFVKSKFKPVEEDKKLDEEEKKSKLQEIKEEAREAILNMLKGAR